LTEPKSSNITWHASHVERADRERVLAQRGATVWLTGLSGSGKSTIAVGAERALLERGRLAYVLDGDNVRYGLNKNLGFSADDRQENIRRIGEVAKLFADAGVVTMTSFISPYRRDRALARALHEQAELPFVEVFVDTPVEVCEQRDPKGLYARARRGELKGFTGVDDPYEPPLEPEVVVRTVESAPAEIVAQILDYLLQRGLLLGTGSIP
jgi:adenylylsulfate kinase